MHSLKDDKFKELTRGTKKLIKDTIKEHKVTNRYDLCSIICEELEERFTGDTLTYQLSRMNLETTGDILDAIDTYMYKHSKESDFSSNAVDDEEEAE